jgi:hypothetical protein
MTVTVDSLKRENEYQRQMIRLLAKCLGETIRLLRVFTEKG